jgi:serine/threonine protein kinase
LARKVALSKVFCVLSQIAQGAAKEIPLPTMDDDYIARCQLGQGNTSDVFCVQKKKDFYVLKVAKEGSESTIHHEQEVMAKMAQDSRTSDHANLSHLHRCLSVDFQGRCAIPALLTFPSAVVEKRKLTRDDAVCLASALSALHQSGYVHRDVSPDNVGHYERSGAHIPLLRDFGYSVPLENCVLFSSSSFFSFSIFLFVLFHLTFLHRANRLQEQFQQLQIECSNSSHKDVRISNSPFRMIWNLL